VIPNHLARCRRSPNQVKYLEGIGRIVGRLNQGSSPRLLQTSFGRFNVGTDPRGTKGRGGLVPPRPTHPHVIVSVINCILDEILYEQ
jgi:hypothetical protein